VRAKAAAGWRVRSLVREGVENTVCGGWRTVALIAVGALVVTGVSFLEARAVGTAQAAEQALLARGSSAIVVSPRPNSGLTINVEQCGALDRAQGIRAAGPVWTLESMMSRTVPNRPIQTLMAAFGGIEVLSGTPTSSPLWTLVASEALASELGLVPGSQLAVSGVAAAGQNIEVSAVLNLGQRRAAHSTALVVQGLNTSPPEECWIEFLPWVRPAMMLETAASFSGGANDLSLTLLLPPNELTQTPIEEFARRPIRHGWLAAGSLLAAMSFFVNRARRREDALYRAFRAGRFGTILISLTETLIIGGVVLGISAAWLLIAYGFADSSPASMVLGLSQAVRAVWLFQVLVWVTSLLGLRKPLIDLLKE
jgi:hypothetical protein